MSANLSNLGSVNVPSLNYSAINDSTQVVSNILTTTRDNVGDFWFISSITVLFLVLIYFLYRKDGDFLYDITRSIFISSSLCLFISVSFLLSTIVQTVMPIFWFSSLFILSLIGVYNLKSRGS